MTRLTEEQQSGIVLNGARVFCPLHFSPLIEQWPKGFEKISKYLYDAWMDEREYASLGDALNPIVDPNIIHTMLDEKPLCCRVEPQTLMKAYINSKLGRQIKCYGCKTERLGFIMKGEYIKDQPVCFYCLVHRVEVNRAQATEKG